MNDLRPSMLALVLGIAVAVSAGTAAQGQSPTSPLPRPGIPDPGSLPGARDTSPDTAPTPRLEGRGRFASPDSRELGGPAESGNEPPRDQATESPRSRSSQALPGGGLRTVVGGAGGQPASSGLINGGGLAGSGTPMAVGPAFSAGGGAVSGTVAGATGALDLILEREVEYPPLPEGGEVLIDLKGPVTVAEFMEDIRLATLWNILISESARDKVLDFGITETTPQYAMEILKFYDLYYEYDKESGYLYIMTVEEWQQRQFGDLEAHTFVLEHVDNGNVDPLIASLLSSAGRMVTDPRTRRIYVWDTPDNIELMKQTVAELDVPLEKREFRVTYADFSDMEAALGSMLSPAGSLLPNSRTNSFIAWDQPDVLDRMGDALQSLDIPVASRTFKLQYVHADDMLDYLEVMLSDNGVIQADPRVNTLIVTDLPEQLDRIERVLAEVDQELESRTWVVDYADLDFLAEQIESRIPVEMGDIIVQEDVHQITVTGIPSRLDEIDRFITVSDVQRKQVLIEAFIVEVGADVEREFNINWSYFGSRGNSPIFFDAGSGFTPDSGNLNVGQLPYSVPLYGALELDSTGQIVRPIVTNVEGENVVDRIAGNNLAVTLKYLDKENKATVLSSPSLAVQDGEEASFENKTEVPFVSATTFFNNNAISSFGNVNNTNRVEFIDVGTILRVLPRITTKNNILLDISAEDSTFVEVRVLASDQQSTVPQKTVRKAETQLRIQSGDTAVLGGLRRDRAGKTESRTPILGDLPGIGRLFRYPNRKSEKSTLMIFITPTIVDEFTAPQAAALADAEASIAEEHRYNQKSLWGRIAATVSQRHNELMVAVGQNGDIHAASERVTMTELRALFSEAPAQVLVVLRSHPSAPQPAITAIKELAMETDRKFEVDNDLVPLVPRYRHDRQADETLEPSAPPEP